MLPYLREGDVVVQKDFEIHDGYIVIISINSDESTCKQVIKQKMACSSKLLTQLYSQHSFLQVTK